MTWTTRIIQILLAAAYVMFGILKLSAHELQMEVFTSTYGYSVTSCTSSGPSNCSWLRAHLRPLAPADCARIGRRHRHDHVLRHAHTCTL